jgi:hypothetical protein
MKPTLYKAGQSKDAKLSYTCPWCNTETSSRIEAGSTRAGDEYSSGLVMLGHCAHGGCGAPVLVVWTSQHGFHWFNALTREAEMFSLRIIPPALPTYKGAGVPQPIARDFTEALRSDASGFLLGASLVGRRVLQAAVRDKGGTGKDLKAEINSLDANLLPDLYKKQAHEIRLVGNDAAHAEDISADEVADLIQFTTQVLDHLYVMPEQVRLAAERRAAK